MTSPRYTFSRARRLKDQLIFLRATRKGVRDVRGPLIFHAIAGAKNKGRLGIRISRRCGNAPRRNHIKRLLREAYRLGQHDVAVTMDLVITVKPHEPLRLTEYQSLLISAIGKLIARLSPSPSAREPG